MHQHQEHQVSDQSIQAAHQHAEEIVEQGQQLEKLGKRLHTESQGNQEDPTFVEQAGREIQARGQAALESAAAAESDKSQSTRAFTSAAQSHVEAVEEYLQATKVMMKATQSASRNSATSSTEQNTAQHNPASTDRLMLMYEQLATISREALESGHYEVAFHALSAAIHCANDLGNEEFLRDVEQEAEAQKALIDQAAPESRMSTQAAHRRGGKNMYDSLIQQARVHQRQAKINNRSKGSEPV